MVEPLLFALLVGFLWRVLKGPLEYGVNIVAFVVSGYIPLVLFRSCVQRGVNIFTANGSLLYHRQIKILDLVLVRFLIELIGHMMAYLFVGLCLFAFGLFPAPYDLSYFLLGWFYYAFFTLSVTMIVAPLSEFSEVLEKIIPVITYITIPFSGAFYLVGSLYPAAAAVVLYAPLVHGMEMMRYGIFGPSINPQFDYVYPIAFSLPLLAIGLLLCRVVRRRLVIE
jgi:capsular polysaccharide transport system permease protein